MTRLSDIDAVIARLRAFARPQEMSAACEIADLSALLDDHARLVERLTELRAEEAAWHYGLAAALGHEPYGEYEREALLEEVARLLRALLDAPPAQTEEK